MKKFFIAGFLVLVIIGVTSFIFTRYSSSINQSPSPSSAVPITTIAPISAPLRSDRFNLSGVKFFYSGNPLSFPDSLPTYSFSYQLGLDTKAASLAAIVKIPTQNSSTVPGVFDWIIKGSALTYNDKTKTLSFADHSSSSLLSSKELFTVLSATNFLSDKFTTSEFSRVLESSSEDGDNGQDSGTVVTYKALLTGQIYPFYFSPSYEYAGETRLDEKGQVVSFSFLVQPTTITQKDTRKLLSLDQIVDLLNKGSGLLVSIEGSADTYPFAATPAFTSIQISYISLAYLLIPETSLFAPIYIIEGTGTGSQTQRVKYFLRASS